MKKLTFVFVMLCSFVLACVFSKNMLADNSYPFAIPNCESCPSVDPYGFCKSHCTSYVAFMLNSYGVNFTNSYKSGGWHNASSWNNAAIDVGIKVDNHPVPGDVAFWNSLSGAGHVAWVEKVYFDPSGEATNIDITEYNYEACSYSSRKISANDPDGFIHILAYNEGVTGLFYLDSYENSSPGQSKEEWGWILKKVWSSYRCKNGCNSNYAQSYIDTMAYNIGMGGGPGYEIWITDDPTPNLPDFKVEKSWLETPWGTEAYKYGLPEIAKMKAQFKNVGEGACSGDIEVHFYLSRGYKEDPHSGDGSWTRVGTDFIQCENLQPGQTQTETEGIELWRDIPEPGIWNIVACIDHPQDDHNNGGNFPEEHESNNCSTEAVFEVTSDGQAVNVPQYDLIISSLSLTNTASPASVFSGDLMGAKMAVRNIGNAASPSGIRSSYEISGPGTGYQWTMIADDGSDAGELTPGRDQWEEINSLVSAPTVPGAYALRACADYQNAVAETDETNNCQEISFDVVERPAPKLVISQFKDQKGCCTTNTGDYVYPDIWVRNDGPAAPSANVTVIYQISSPVGTGGIFQTIGYGTIEPRELPPGGTDEDYMDGSRWRIPKSSAWKNQWHTVRACLIEDGSFPTGDPNLGDICAAYNRYSKK